jgi:hypothetical protein
MAVKAVCTPPQPATSQIWNATSDLMINFDIDTLPKWQSHRWSHCGFTFPKPRRTKTGNGSHCSPLPTRSNFGMYAFSMDTFRFKVLQGATKSNSMKHFMGCSPFMVLLPYIIRKRKAVITELGFTTIRILIQEQTQRRTSGALDLRKHTWGFGIWIW